MSATAIEMIMAAKAQVGAVGPDDAAADLASGKAVFSTFGGRGVAARAY